MSLRFPEDGEPVLALLLVAEHGDTVALGERGDLRTDVVGDALCDGTFAGTQRESDQSCVRGEAPSPKRGS